MLGAPYLKESMNYAFLVVTIRENTLSTDLSSSGQYHVKAKCIQYVSYHGENLCT